MVFNLILMYCVPEKKKNEHTFMCSFLVHEAGVEPARPCEHWHLKPASLPIPPLVHQMVLRNKFLSRRDLYSSTVHLKCQQLFLEIKKLLSESLSPSLPHGEKYPHGQKGKETRTELCPLWVSLFALLVRMTGLEPVRAFTHKHLKLASLPIPAHPQISIYDYTCFAPICQPFLFLSFLKKIVDNAFS